MVVAGPETLVVLSSSPEMLKDDLRSIPFQFGNVQLSICVLTVLSVSLIEYVPKMSCRAGSGLIRQTGNA